MSCYCKSFDSGVNMNSGVNVNKKLGGGKYETTMQGLNSNCTVRWSNKDHKIAKIGLSGPILKGI